MTQLESVGASQTALKTPLRKPHRWWRRILLSSLALLLLIVGATAAVGYYFSGVLLTVDHSVSYPLTVEEVNGNRVTLDRDPMSERPIVLGLTWAGGYAVLSSAVTVEGDSVERTVTSVVRGRLEPGLAVAVDEYMHDGDPKTARGLDFEAVTIRGDLGELPAWLIPPTAGQPTNTWVIAVHGRQVTRAETLRVLPTIAATGMAALVLSYRNDEGAPASPDGYYHLGDTEWRDVAAAVRYAHANGASGVVLYGWSMGGAISMTALRRMPPSDAALIRGLVLDSPIMDWDAVLDLQGRNRGLPGFVTWTAGRFAEWRANLDFADFDQRVYAPQLTVPALIFVDESDTMVPLRPAQQFAAARPDLVTLVTTCGAGHVSSWNANPAAYEAALSGFLGQFAAA